MIAALAPVLIFLGPIWSFCTSRVGLPLIVAGGIILFYEGVPIGPLRTIPYAGPVLAGFVDGRVDREYAAGQINERLVWQEKERRAGIKKAAEEAAKQQQLDDVEAAALAAKSKSADDDKRIAALEDSLEKLEREEPDAPPGAPAAKPRKCIATPRIVSKQLNAIGR